MIKVVKTNRFWLNLTVIFFLSLALQGYTIYQAEKPKEPVYTPIYNSPVVLDEFVDGRPDEEREGLKGKELMVFGTTDKNFKKSISQFVVEKLKEELLKGGVKAEAGTESATANYRIKGKIIHFQAVAKLEAATMIPYLGSVLSLGAEDKYTTNVNIQVQLLRGNIIIFDKPYSVSEDLALKTGLLNLERMGRGYDYQVKALELALENVSKQVTADVVNTLKQEEGK